MKLPEIAIKNFRFTVLIQLLLVIMGLYAFITMPRYEDPQFGAPGLVVVIIYPGASPEDIESQVMDPIEDKLKDISDLERAMVMCFEGIGTLAFKYEFGIDQDEKYNEILREINSVRDQLPNEVAEIRFEPIITNSVNIYQFALISEDAPYQFLNKEAESFQDKLEKITGVSQVDIHAMPDRIVKIDVELDKLAMLGIPLRQVAGAIQTNNEVIPGGNLSVSTMSYSVISNSKYENLDDIKNTVVYGTDGKIVLLKDIADISFGYEDVQYIARYNGKRCVFVTVQQKVGSNIKFISKSVEEIFEKQKSDLPTNMELALIFNQAESVKSRTNIFFLNLLQGIALVGIIIGIIVGFRASLIIMMAVPVSIVIGIGMVDMSDYGLQQMTIAGMIIALGLLVDNAIVVTENVARFMELGYKAKDAAIKGAGQVGWPIISSTATTILAFLPLTNVQDASGDFVKSMPLTVIFTISASLLVALSLTPFITTRFFNEKTFATKNFVQRWLDRLIKNQYANSLDFVLHNKTFTLFLAAGLFIVSIYTFQTMGLSFFPKAEKPILMVEINTPNGSNIEFTDTMARKAEAILSEYELIEGFATNVGHGNPKVYYSHFPSNRDRDHAQIFVQLKKYEAEEVNDLKVSIRERLESFTGCRIKVYEFAQGPPTDNPIAIRLYGKDLEVINKIADDMEAIFDGIEGVRDIHNQASRTITSLNVNINKAKAGILGVQVADINQTLRAAINGAEISKFNDIDGKQYDIVLRLKDSKEMSHEVFDQLYVPSVTGAQVPLAQVATVEFKTSPYMVKHFNYNRSTVISADAEEGYNVNELTGQILSQVREYNFPEGYGFIVAGEREKLGQSLQGIGIAAIIAIIGIFSVLVLQFRSFVQPLIIFSALPFAIIGSVFTLLILGMDFSFTAFVGLTSLIGIVVNDSIILIDFANQSMREGKDKLTSIREAGQVRFIPIILTTLTTVGGLLPLTLRGGTLWAPMGWTIIGGLLVSTFLILYVVPVLYMIYSGKD